MKPRVIDSFDDEYRFLSNFFMCAGFSICWRGFDFSSTEKTYQWEKCARPEDKAHIMTLESPGKIKRFASAPTPMMSMWDNESYRLHVMNRLVTKKFAESPLKDWLIATGDAYLKEGNHWCDQFWGNCTCLKCADIEGQNHLGKILMEVRSKLSDK